ncbi:MAG: 50S ribosomal protein L11 methyltransferase [Rhodanobacteraceae bacterium]
MPWFELQLTIDAAAQPQAEAALEDLGALSVTLMDADADTPDEAAIFEPGVGETPLWKSLTLLALFDTDADRRGLVHALQDTLPELAPERIGFREVADQDWERAWMDRFKPMRFGRRLWIYPWNMQPPADASCIVVRLDPGLAFGTGTHPTTALCLERLDGLDLAGQRVLDYGCGSGVLAIAALKLGAAHALAVDNDPQALIATRDNAARNGVAARLHACQPGELPQDARVDALVANILAEPLDVLAPHLAALCAPGAALALSGILAGQETALLERYRASGFTELRTMQRKDWVRIDGYWPGNAGS